MTIQLTDAAIGSGLAAAVPALTLAITPGAPIALAVETDERPLVVSMLLGGRIKPDSGTISPDLDTLRRTTALVDTPFVAEPAAGVSLGLVVAEEFAFARRKGSVRRFLEEHGLADYEKVEVRALPPADRVRIFCELALLRDGVDTLVLTSPERHGGAPAEWFPFLSSLVATVVVVTDAPTRDLLVALGARDATESQS